MFVNATVLLYLSFSALCPLITNYVRKIGSSISFFSPLFLLLSLSFFYHSLHHSWLWYPWMITPYPGWTTFNNLIGVKELSGMRRPNDFTRSSVIGSLIICLSFRINCVINCTANQFTIEGKSIVGRRPVKSFFTLFTKPFWDVRRKLSVIWLTASGFRESQYEFHIISNL